MRLLLLIVALFTIAGCTPKPTFFPYSSDSEIPVETRTTWTEITFVPAPGQEVVLRACGVFAAVDNAATPYVLLAPRRIGVIGRSRSPYEFYDTFHGVPLSLEKARELIQFLADCEMRWDSKPTYNDAIYMEYTLTQKHDKPALWLIFQNNRISKEVRFLYGSRFPQDETTYKGKNSLARLRENISRALERIVE